MEKKEIINNLINFYKGIQNRCLIVDTNNSQGISKLALNVLIKEIENPLNVTFISPSDEYFKEVFPKLEDSIKLNTKYSIGKHKISFFKMEKTLVKKPPEETEILIVYPTDTIKEKDLVKIMEGSKKMKKAILLAKSVSEVNKNFKKFNPAFISLKPSHDTIYYNAMKQKLFDIK